MFQLMMIRWWCCIAVVAIPFITSADPCVPGSVWEDKNECQVYNCTSVGLKIGPSKTCPGRCYDPWDTKYWHPLGTHGVSSGDCKIYKCTEDGWQKQGDNKDKNCANGGCQSSTTGYYHEIGFSVTYNCMEITCTDKGWILPPTDECSGKCFDNTTNKWWDANSTTVMAEDCLTYTCDAGGDWVDPSNKKDSNCEAGGCKSGDTGKYYEIGFYFEYNCMSFECTNNTQDGGWVVEKLPGCSLRNVSMESHSKETPSSAENWVQHVRSYFRSLLEFCMQIWAYLRNSAPGFIA